MKVLEIIETGGGGSGRHILDLVSGLITKGHDVHVVHSPLRAEAAFEAKLQALQGASVVSMDIRKVIGIHDLSVLFELRRYILDNGPFDVVHGHSSKAGALGRLAATGTTAARLYTPHGLYTLNPVLKPLKKKVYGLIEGLLARTISDGVIAVSDKEYDHALSLGFPQQKMFLVGNGVDRRDRSELAATREKVRRRLGLPDDLPVVGFVGRFCTAKAAERFVALARKIRDGGQEARFILLGSGRQAADIDNMIASYGLADYLQVFPNESGEEFMPAFDVYTLTSRYEAMPYVLLEALAAGRPIVATDVGGSRTAIDDGVNGFVVPQQDDLSELVGKISRLVADRALRERMGHASYQKAQDFSLDTMVQSTLDVYETVIARNMAYAT